MQRILQSFSHASRGSGSEGGEPSSAPQAPSGTWSPSGADREAPREAPRPAAAERLPAEDPLHVCEGL